MEFDDEFPKQKDYSTDAKVEITVENATELVAVFTTDDE